VCGECKQLAPISQVTGKVLRHGYKGGQGPGCAGRDTRPLTPQQIREQGIEL
jgi:hypothetical protein